MKKFIVKIIFIFIIGFIIFYTIVLLLLITNTYKIYVAGNDTYTSIKKSKEKSNKKILLIGDSVGRQLFNNSSDNDSINSLACNQAIGVIGQYFLLKNYFNVENRPKEVYMLYSPFSFKNNLNQVYTFHYFLKPFYNQEYKSLFSNTAIHQTKKIPYSKFCQEPYILTTNWAPIFEPQDSIKYSFLSPISKEYLEKIKILCATNDSKLYILPTPTRESNRNTVNNINSKEFLGLNVENELRYYLNNIVYLPDSLFVDDVHLKNPETIKHNVLHEMIKARTHN
jgi:hypothetical protein